MRIQPGIAPIHIYFMMIMSSGLVNHVLILPLILSAAGRDPWLCVVVSIVPYIIWILLIGAVIKKIGNQNFLEYLKTRLGRVPVFFLTVIFILYFYLNAAITFRDNVTWTKTNSLMNTPLLVLCILLGLKTGEELSVKGCKITLHEPVKDGLHYTVQLKTKAFIDERADEPSLTRLKKKIQQEIKNDVQRTFENGLKLDSNLYNPTESTS
ncbi:GerAB/ArcD/ProY family transporter [Metabacillus idriensis]|uniref:GerAB/ArcD/ProY family transporter n=1 Tax=Metabacillus idriensis TaxID=324768 RepID=UPI003D2B64D4